MKKNKKQDRQQEPARTLSEEIGFFLTENSKTVYVIITKRGKFIYYQNANAVSKSGKPIPTRSMPMNAKVFVKL